MSILLIVTHVVVCIALIMIVLLQTGKGADMGAAFGGGSSQTLFGSTGASTFLSKATTVAAIVFMLTSLTLAYMSGGKVTKSVVTDTQAPIEQSSQTGTNAADAGSKSE
ncbi:preprotein translocase subunit SecG [uncultured Desulfosarcina sp.]|uniref:preprotein translocase subunit SecG n=1 Tax=uncultured Desulfosarcina sp. TaxID=218289 RepID=UPI0029C7FDFE|nr:preprotein translocase subunit SecG [uncultured Desulfosarcina sp.]